MRVHQVGLAGTYFLEQGAGLRSDHERKGK